MLLGFIRLKHLTPKPAGYRYPYPDSFMVVFSSVADERLPGPLQIEDEWVVDAQFVPTAEAAAADLESVDRVFLDDALGRR